MFVKNDDNHWINEWIKPKQTDNQNCFRLPSQPKQNKKKNSKIFFTLVGKSSNGNQNDDTHTLL